MLLLTPFADPNALLCGLALCVTLVAANDRRLSAMMLASGVAVGCAPAGLLLAPFAIGMAVRQRSWRRLPLMPVATLVTAWSLTGWPVMPTLPSLWGLVPVHPHLLALIAAASGGVAVWIIADTASLTTHDKGPLRSLLSLALIVPTAPIALLFPLLVALATAISPARQCAANDNPLVSRVPRLAA